MIVNKNTLDIIEIVNEKSTISDIHSRALYVREKEKFLKIVRLLKNLFDVLLIDGHGILHPRKCALASYVGVIIDKPTIGVAKNLLCGSILESSYVEYNKTILGYTITKNNKKKHLCQCRT